MSPWQLAKRAADAIGSRIAAPLSSHLAEQVRDPIDRMLMLGGLASARQLATIEQIGSLEDVEFQVFSQFGEDGIIEWLIQRLGREGKKIPDSFVEFGVADYSEANTLFLLKHRNWRGFVIDGDPANIDRLRSLPLAWRHDIRWISSFVTRDNINQLIRSAGFSGEIGILSIDIDGNDYWLWSAIDCVSPWIIACEYNAVLGDLHPLSIPYNATFRRSEAHASNLYAGCSIGALQHLAQRTGYVLLGSNRAGNNAFFLRGDIAEPVRNAVADTSARASRFRESRDRDSRFTYLAGVQRVEEIAEMPFCDVKTGATITLRQLGRIYSDAWLVSMGTACE